MCGRPCHCRNPSWFSSLIAFYWLTDWYVPVIAVCIVWSRLNLTLSMLFLINVKSPILLFAGLSWCCHDCSLTVSPLQWWEPPGQTQKIPGKATSSPSSSSRPWKPLLKEPFLFMEAIYPYAIKNQQKARNLPSTGLWVPWAGSLWHKSAGIATLWARSIQSEQNICGHWPIRVENTDYFLSLWQVRTVILC